MNDLDIKKLRKKLGLTQTQFAKKLGVDTKTVQNWEYGRPIPATKHGIIRELADSISVQFEEQQYYGGDQINENGDNIKGENVTVNKSETDKLIDALSQEQAIARKSQEQIDRLIALLEKFAPTKQ